MTAMCGRYATTASTSDLVAAFDAALAEDDASKLQSPSYNVAPTQTVPVILERPSRRDPDSQEDDEPEIVRQLRAVRWGLVPSWAKDPGIGSRMINARSETLTDKPSFKVAAARRRCILPAAGFFEWTKDPEGKKLPYFLHDPDTPILGFAGLYELWPDPGKAKDDPDRWLWTTTVITRPATDALGHIHDRTPVIVTPDLRDDWLDCTSGKPSVAKDLLEALPEPHLVPYRVSTEVNSVRNNRADLIEPV
jgi:putative SOS response-associated peptidase YedK